MTSIEAQAYPPGPRFSMVRTMKVTSRVVVLHGRELQIQFSDDGQFEELDPLEYATLIVPASQGRAAFRFIDITESNADVLKFPQPIGSQHH